MTRNLSAGIRMLSVFVAPLAFRQERQWHVAWEFVRVNIEMGWEWTGVYVDWLLAFLRGSPVYSYLRLWQRQDPVGMLAI